MAWLREHWIFIGYPDEARLLGYRGSQGACDAGSEMGVQLESASQQPSGLPTLFSLSRVLVVEADLGASLRPFELVGADLEDMDLKKRSLHLNAISSSSFVDP